MEIDQDVVGNPLGRAGAVDADGTGGEVEPGQSAVHGAHPVQSAEPVESGPVVARPFVRAGHPHAEFLSTEQTGFGGDAGDLEALGQLERGQDSGVAEPGDDNALHHATVSGAGH